MSGLVGLGDRFGSVAVLLLVLLVLVHLGLAVLARPQRGLLVLAALLPFDGLLVVVPGGDSVGAWKEALLLGVLLATFLSPQAARRARSARVLPSGLAAWLPPLVGLLSIGLVSAVLDGGVVGLIGLKVNFFYALVPLILWRTPFDRAERDRLVTILMATGVATAVFGLAQQVLGAERLNQMGFEYNTNIRFAGGLLRSFSTFTQPFSFALFVTLVLLVCLPVALSDPRRTRNTLFLVATPVLAAGMAASVVRGAYVATLVGLVFLVFWGYRGLVHVLVPGALVAGVVLSGTLGTAFLSASSLGQRTTGWSLVWERIVGAPLGNGIGVTSSAAEKALELGADRQSVLVLDGQAYQPDNYYVKTLLELGPLGLWLFLLLGAGAVYAAVRASRGSVGNDRALAAGVGASVLGAAAAATVSTYLEVFPLDFYFWLLLGVLLCYATPSTSTPSPSVRAGAAYRPTSESSSVP